MLRLAFWAGLLVLLAGLVWLVVVLVTKGVNEAGILASVLGTVLAITGVLVTLVTWWLRHHTAGEQFTGPDMNSRPRASTAPSLPAGEQVVVGGEIPREAPGFQSRQALMDRLTHAGSHSGTVLCTVTGGRGVGKTQLAAAYARKRIADRWSVVTWINAESEGQVIAGWEQLAEELGVHPVEGDSGHAARAARAHLARLGGPSLVIFDNATDSDVLAPWLPRHGETQVVVTTVNRAFEDFGESVEVDLFTEQEALDFLCGRIGSGDEEGARALLEELERLPLALAHAAALIRRERVSYDVYLDRLRTFPIDQYLTRPAGDPYLRGTAQAILLAVIDAEQTDSTGLTWALLEVLSVLSAAGTYRWLLHVAAREMLPDHDEMSATAAVDRALGVLAEASILTLSVDGTTVIMHRLLGRVLRDRASQQTWQVGMLVATCQALESVTVRGDGGWPERARAEHLVEQIDAFHSATQSVDMPTDIVERVLDLRRWAAGYLFQVADASRVAAVCAALIADEERVRGADHPSIVPLRTYLASSYLSAERFDDAIELLKEKFESDCWDYGPEDQAHTVYARINLASAYEKAGRLDEAIGLYEEALYYRKLTLGPEHPLTLRAQTLLASAHHAAGRLTEAVERHRATVTECERVLGSKNWVTLEARNALAWTYEAAEQFNDAIMLLGLKRS